MATPLGILVLALVGIAWTIWRLGGRLEVLVLLNLACLLALRALPHTPGHDGVRQFLPAMGCLALIASFGATCLINRFGAWGKSMVVVTLLEAAVSIWLMMPVPLSYFSPVCGGLPGAVALGMEPTYYWDALTDDALGWINTHTLHDRPILFSAVTHQCFYLNSSGRLKPKALFFPLAGDIDRYLVKNRPWTWYEFDHRLIDRFGSHRVIAARQNIPLGWKFSRADITSVLSDWQWYIVQNRPGFLTRLDQQLINQFGPSRVITAKWGIPLVWAFSLADVAAVMNQ